MLAEVAPVLHEYEIPPVAVSVTLAPLQMLALLGVTFGWGVTFTVRDAVAVQPLALVTVTV